MARGAGMQTETPHEFMVLANYLNFRKAADQLHISQPTLSNHITSLERELGFRLFDREGGTHLTRAGAHFYSSTQNLLESLAKSIEESRALAKENPPVRIQSYGKEDSILNRVISQIETPFQIVAIDSTMPVLAPFDSGEADVVVTPHAPHLPDHTPKGVQVSYLPIGEVALTLLLSKSNPLARHSELTREDLRRARIFIPYGNSYDWGKSFAVDAFGEDLDLVFEQDPSVPIGPDNIPLRGLGQRISIGYRGASHRACIYQPDLVAFDELDGEPWTTMEYLVYRTEDPNPNVQAFVQEVQRLVGERKTA